MSTYKALVGKKIKSVSSDPSDSIDGQMWYNTTTQSLRGVAILEAWINSSVLPSTRQLAEGAGTQTAGLAIGGATGPGVPTYLNTSCEYNGTGWSGTDTKNAAAAIAEATFGTQTAAVAAGGYTGSSPAEITAVEEYNGSSWTSVTAMPQGTRSAMGCGAETSGLVVGGEADPGVITNTQEYNGSSWTAGGAIPAATYVAGAGGTTESNSWFAGGYPFKNTTFLYNGSSWTASGNINTARHSLGGAGISTAALIFGGVTPPSGATTATENFDGSSWTTSPATLGTAASNAAAFGTKTAAVYAGNDPATNTTQEYNSSINVITAAAWASGGSLNTARTSMFTGPIGTQTAGYAAGGSIPSGRSNATEEYDGSSWTTVNTVPVSLSSRGGAGTQTAAVLFSGNPDPSTVTTTTEYDGTNYSEGGAMNNTRGYGPIASGTQTAALGGGGYDPSAGNITVTEYYNGTAWTSQPAANPATYGGASGGTQTATWMLAGIQQPPSPTKAVVEWDGSSWTAGASYATDHVVNLFGGGPQTAAWMCGGQIYPGSGLRAFTNHYDGTVWATAPSLGTARSGACQGGTQAAGLVAGGISSLPSTRTNVTEEFTGETTAANVETFSTS